MASLGIWLLLSTLLLASLVVVHLALLWAVVSSAETSTRDRLLALLPPLLPWVAYRAGNKVLALCWCFCLVGYTILRMLG